MDLDSLFECFRVVGDHHSLVIADDSPLGEYLNFMGRVAVAIPTAAASFYLPT